MTTKIIGEEKYIRRLQRLGGEPLVREAGRVVYVAADFIRTEAALSITQGSTSGAGHIPSLPGEPPNRDTGQLDTSIIVQRKGRISAQVIAQAPYSTFLEFGTSKMAERPFMRPAAKKGKGLMTKLIQQAITKVNRSTT
jgi:HK97 gp10 family phage protein